MDEVKHMADWITEEEKKKVDVSKMIKDLINTSFGGSNEEQMKAVQLMKGLSLSDDPKSNKFMQSIDKFTSALDPKDFE
jgi:hypothetical protein